MTTETSTKIAHFRDPKRPERCLTIAEKVVYSDFDKGVGYVVFGWAVNAVAKDEHGNVRREKSDNYVKKTGNKIAVARMNKGKWVVPVEHVSENTPMDLVLQELLQRKFNTDLPSVVTNLVRNLK